MERLKHLFQFDAGQIGKAAMAEATYHHARVGFWKAEQEKAIVKAKEAGVEIREHDVTGGKSVEVVVDPTVSNRLTVCANKIRTHQEAADRFVIEADAYDSQNTRVYDLDPDDVVYFRLAGGDRED